MRRRRWWWELCGADVERGRREAGGCGCGSSVVVLAVVVVWWTLQSTGRQAGKARQAVAALSAGFGRRLTVRREGVGRAVCLAGDWLRAVLLSGVWQASRGERAHGAGWLAQAEILLSPMISLCFDGRRGVDLLKELGGVESRSNRPIEAD